MDLTPQLGPIERVIIVGAGWVGRQVAAKLASRGLRVGLVDRTVDIAREAREWISHCIDSDDPLNQQSPLNADSSPAASPRTVLDRHAANQIRAEIPWLAAVDVLAGLDELTREEIACWKPQLVIECVSEQISLKRRVLRRLGELIAADCIIASNSSYFVPSLLSKFVSSPERFAHLHFHVPVLRNSVADIVGCEQTMPEVLDRLTELTQRVGQYPLLLRHEHPGYVFNWLLQAVLKAALELVAQDVVDAADVDRSWKSVTGMALGPFGLMDQIGLDVIEQVLSNARWVPRNSITDQQLLQIIRPMIEAGTLGIKSGIGFYNYRQHSQE